MVICAVSCHPPLSAHDAAVSACALARMRRAPGSHVAAVTRTTVLLRPELDSARMAEAGEVLCSWAWRDRGTSADVSSPRFPARGGPGDGGAEICARGEVVAAGLAVLAQGEEDRARARGVWPPPWSRSSLHSLLAPYQPPTSSGGVWYVLAPWPSSLCADTGF